MVSGVRPAGTGGLAVGEAGAGGGALPFRLLNPRSLALRLLHKPSFSSPYTATPCTVTVRRITSVNLQEGTKDVNAWLPAFQLYISHTMSVCRLLLLACGTGSYRLTSNMAPWMLSALQILTARTLSVRRFLLFLCLQDHIRQLAGRHHGRQCVAAAALGGPAACVERHRVGRQQTVRQQPGAEGGLQYVLYCNRYIRYYMVWRLKFKTVCCFGWTRGWRGTAPSGASASCLSTTPSCGWVTIHRGHVVRMFTGVPRDTCQ